MANAEPTGLETYADVVIRLMAEPAAGKDPHAALGKIYHLRPERILQVKQGIDAAQHGEVKLGGGPSVTHGTCNHPAVIARLLEVAKQLNIPIQHESSSRYSGTDTDVIFETREGIPSALISLPLRYMHSVVEMADLNDVKQVIELLTAFVESVSETDKFGIKL